MTGYSHYPGSRGARRPVFYRVRVDSLAFLLFFTCGVSVFCDFFFLVLASQLGTEYKENTWTWLVGLGCTYIKTTKAKTVMIIMHNLIRVVHVLFDLNSH